MIVDDYMDVLGSGWVLIAYGDELEHMPMHCGQKIASGGTTFTIKGVERSKYDDGWWSKRAGFVLSPNNLVPDSFEIGQEIEIINE